MEWLLNLCLLLHWLLLAKILKLWIIKIIGNTIISLLILNKLALWTSTNYFCLSWSRFFWHHWILRWFVLHCLIKAWVDTSIHTTTIIQLFMIILSKYIGLSGIKLRIILIKRAILDIVIEHFKYRFKISFFNRWAKIADVLL